ncbi:MAG: gamma-glutamyltransferase family protein [Defluviitaleaceae bacterium]|nr:gamma-glutamyltransferase family protein [Defluviitaleaceae bacterium]
MFDPNYNPYASHRSVVYGRRGCVATSQPLAAQAGLHVMRMGGNAIDAAVAAAACLTVVEPTSNGIGSDAFAIIWTKGKLHGLNSSGAAPASISADSVRKLGHDRMPAFGWLPVTVPGAPGAWAELNREFGRMSLAEVLAPAISYAREGYPVSPTLGYFWQKAYEAYRKVSGDEFAAWFETFAPKGRAPMVGEIWQSEAHARTLEEIAESRSESFYRGDIARRIAKASADAGGFMTAEDLAAFAPEWVEPISVNYRGYDVWEIPPNGQGIVALAALNILNGYEFAARECVDTAHRQIEAIKLAFTAAKQVVTDPRHVNPGHVKWMLGEGFAAAARAQIGRTAITPQPFDLPKGGTVYLCTADGEGNMVSYIQSNYMGFGSGVVVPGTGIALQNRGHDFSLDEGHVNCLAGGKKTYHTIIPGFLTKGGAPVGSFGVMGGYMQPQGHAQVIMNTVDFALNPQMALDAPRFQWIEGRTVEVERSFPAHIAEALASRGHDVRVPQNSGGFGRGQIIWRDPQSGVLAAGTESRTDGAVAAY